MSQMTRRQMLRTGATGLALLGSPGPGLWSANARTLVAGETGPNDPPRPWEIGCFNRPWGALTYDEALAGMQQAGFRLTGILGDHVGEPFTSPEATPAYLDRLKERIAAHGLTVIVGWLRTRHDIALETAISLAHRQIDHAQRLGIRFLLTAGVDPPEQFDHFYRVMADAAQYAQAAKIQIVLKPHGGCSLAATEILHCLDRVGHDNFRIWYDAGNIVHYSDQDPITEATRLARWVTGFCAKDCPGPRGPVMLPFGEGKVPFAPVLARLKAGGFAGPVMVECCGGKTFDQITAGARANREFLERVIREL